MLRKFLSFPQTKKLPQTQNHRWWTIGLWGEKNPKTTSTEIKQHGPSYKCRVFWIHEVMCSDSAQNYLEKWLILNTWSSIGGWKALVTKPAPVPSPVQGLGSHGLKPAKQGQVRWSTAWTWQPALDHECPVKCLLFNTSFPPPTLFWSIPDLVFTRDFDSHSVEPNRVRGRWAQRLHVRALVSAYMALKSQLRPLLTMWPGKKQLWPCFFIGKRGQ